MRRLEYSKLSLITLVLYSFLLIFLVSCGSHNQKGIDIGPIAEKVTQQVALVRDISQKGSNTPVLILEEAHNSRAGRIEQAIVLVRLYEQYGLRHIALEGYLKERPEITTDWFNSITDRATAADRAFIVAQSLREGEISSAEFMKLVYNDISLHPIENMAEYSVSLSQDASQAPIQYLMKIAERSYDNERKNKLDQLSEDFKRIEEEGDKKALDKKRDEIFDCMFSADPWVKNKADILLNNNVVSTEEKLAAAKEIIKRAKKLSINFDLKKKEAMNGYLKFFSGRSDATKTMVNFTKEIIAKYDPSIIAMIVGAAHTQKACELLEKSKHPFAVIRPQSFTGDIPIEMFERKYDKLSIYSEGLLTETLPKQPLSIKKNPEPVLDQPWYQGKVELYTYIDKIVQRIIIPSLTVPPPPTPPILPGPPFGFSNDDLRGRFVSIDPSKIIIVPARSGDNKAKAVLFPANLNGTEIWIKAGISNETASKTERQNVEAILKKALNGVRSGKIGKSLESDKGIVNINIDVLAGIAVSKTEAKSIDF